MAFFTGLAAGVGLSEFPYLFKRKRTNNQQAMILPGTQGQSVGSCLKVLIVDNFLIGSSLFY